MAIHQFKFWSLTNLLEIIWCLLISQHMDLQQGSSTKLLDKAPFIYSSLKIPPHWYYFTLFLPYKKNKSWAVHVRHHGGRTELGELTTNSNIPVYNSSFNSWKDRWRLSRVLPGHKRLKDACSTGIRLKFDKPWKIQISCQTIYFTEGSIHGQRN